MVNPSICDFYYDHYQPKIRIRIRNEKLIFMVNRCRFHLVTNKSHKTDFPDFTTLESTR